MNDQTVTGLMLAVVVLVMIGVAALGWIRFRANRRRRAEIRAMAARRGLHLVERKDGGARVLELTDPETGGVLTATADQTRRKGDEDVTTKGSTVLRLGEPRFEGALMVVTAPMTSGLAAGASKLLGFLDNSVARRLLSGVVGDDIASHIGHLTVITPPPGVAISMLASSDPGLVFDAAVLARAVALAPRSNDTLWSGLLNFEIRISVGGTMIVLSERGTQIIVQRDLNEASDLEALLDAGRLVQQAQRQ